MSLFGSSLFGNLGGASTASTQAGTSAANSTTTNAASSLFNLSSTTQQQQQKPTATSSLFGNTQTQTQQQQQQPQPAATSSLFGNTQQQNQNTQAQQSFTSNGASLQGNAGTSQTAYFDSLLERSRKRRDADEGKGTFEELPRLHLGLGDISQRVREMGGSAGASQRGKPVDSKAHYLLAASGITPGAALRDLNSLKAQAATVSEIQPPQAFDPDNAAYISNLQSQSTLASISEGLNRSARDFDRFLEENVTIEWDTQRRKIYEHFGLARPEQSGNQEETSFGTASNLERGSFGKGSRRSRGQGLRGSQTAKTGAFGTSGRAKSVIGTPRRSGTDQTPLFADVADRGVASSQPGLEEKFSRDKQTRFAEKVQLLNEARIQERVFPVFREFGGVEEQGGDDQTSQLVDAYKALIEIVSEDPTAEGVSEPNAVKERQFAREYLSEDPKSAPAVRISKLILDGSRRFVEKSFFRQLEEVVSKNPREARIGGVPTTFNKVRGYVNIRAAKRDLVPEGSELQVLDGNYCWVIIFYLLRSGFPEDALDYVKSNLAEFRSLDRNFVTYIANYAKSDDRRLEGAVLDRINAEYNQRSRIAPDNSVDPYRLACYKIIGRCDLGKRSLDLMNQGIEDWIWLQFNLARESQRLDEPAGESFGAADVRTVIREIGQRYFEKGSTDSAGGYGVYFLLLILGGMFEQAVAYLYSYSHVSAVHFAIALDFYGLLRVSDFNASDSELVSYTTREYPQINFGRMLGYYTRDFRAARVEVAVDYLTLICLNADLPGPAGVSQSSLCNEALRELVLETREFAKLLGDIYSDGQRVPGAIERRLKLIKIEDHGSFLSTVTIQAAHIADDHGRTTDAVLLYHLAEEYDNVIAIVNRALSDAIAIDFGQETLKLQPAKPRVDVTQAQQQQQQQQVNNQSGISLSSVDSPIDLARNLIGLYNSNAMYHSRIKPSNRDACGVLLRMTDAKALVETGSWPEALDIIDSLDLLPLRASGSIPRIRSSASAFPALPQPVARNIGNLVLWTITCLGRQREVLGRSEFEDTPTRERIKEELAQKARDLMVYAGLVRLRLSSRVYEAVVGAGGDWA